LKHEQDKLRFEQSKKEDFDDLLSGKKRTEDKTLQELFKEYYAKIKETETRDYVNGAKSSLNSFSSILEKKREAYRQKTA